MPRRSGEVAGHASLVDAYASARSRASAGREARRTHAASLVRAGRSDTAASVVSTTTRPLAGIEGVPSGISLMTTSAGRTRGGVSGRARVSSDRSRAESKDRLGVARAGVCRFASSEKKTKQRTTLGSGDGLTGTVTNNAKPNRVSFQQSTRGASLSRPLRHRTLAFSPGDARRRPLPKTHVAALSRSYRTCSA